MAKQAKQAKQPNQSEPSALQALFGPHLEPGEKTTHVAYGIKPRYFFGVVIFRWLPETEYWVALTTKGKVIVVRTKGDPPRQVTANVYRIDQVQAVKTSTGPIFVRIAIKQPGPAVKVAFNRIAFKANRANAMAIAQALETRQLEVKQLPAT